MYFIKKICFSRFNLLLVLIIIFNVQANAQVVDSTATDSAMLKQVEEMMKSNEPAPVKTRSGISANPDIGVVGDFQGSYLSTGKKFCFGIGKEK